MARDHARIDVEIWNDKDFLALKTDEQHAYLMLTTHPNLSYCGVIDYVPARFTHLSGDLTQPKFKARLASLERERFLVIDYDTAEILVRSYVRHDGLLKQPNVTKAMASALRQVVSRGLRGVVIDELARARRGEPKAKGWNGLGDTFPKLLAEIDRKAFDNPSASPSGKGDSNA